MFFKQLSYCFEKTIGVDIKALSASRTVSRLIRWYNKSGDITKEFWEKAIQFYGNFFMDWKFETVYYKGRFFSAQSFEKMWAILPAVVFTWLMTLNHAELGHVVTLMKYLASIVYLLFLWIILISNKITFPVSNFLNLAELVVNESMKSIYKKIYQYSFFYSIYRWLM